MQMLHLLNIGVHVLFGIAALLIGLMAIWYNQQPIHHRRYGRWFLRTIIVVVATAAIGVILFRPNPVLIMLTILSGYQSYAGYRAIRLREQRGTLADRLIAGFTLLIGVGYGVAAQYVPGWSSVVVYSTLMALILVTTYDFIKQIWLFDQLKRWWLYEHIYKMLASYNAIVSAFVGTVFPNYKPYSQIGPTVLFGIVLFGFVVHQVRRQKAAALRASLVFGLTMLTGLTEAQLRRGDPAISFKLADQFGKTTTLSLPPHKPVILAFANREGRPLLREWLAKLPPEPATHRLVVACTGWFPFFLKESIRSSFLAQKSVLIDWNNEVARQYGIDDTGCLLVYLNAAGVIIGIERGSVTPTKLNRFIQAASP